MAKLTLTDPSSLANASSFLTQLANNNAAVEAAMEKTLSRDGTSPNQMAASLDMNSNRIINLPSPSSDTEPLRLGDIEIGVDGLGVATQEEAEAGTSNTVLMTPLRTEQHFAIKLIDEDSFATNSATKVPSQQSTKAYVDAGDALSTLKAIVPNTAPSSGQILVGNAGGTAYAPVSMSGDGTLSSAGALAIGTTKITNAMLNSDVFSTAHSWSVRQTFNMTPTYDMASNVLGVGLFMPLDSATHTVAASKQYDHIRISQSGGGNNQFTIGASGIVDGIAVFLESLSGSDSTSNIYAGNFGVTNAGPGTSKAVHMQAFGSGTSSGVLFGGVAQVQPVATSNTASGAFQVQQTGAIDDRSSLIVPGAEGRILFGFGTNVGPISVKDAMFQAWFKTGTDATAYALKVMNNGGTTLGGIDKDANVTGPTITASTSLIASSATNGITIGQATVSRNHANGSLTFAAGTAAGNSFAVETGGTARMSVSDSLVNTTTPFKAVSNTGIPAGGTAGTGLLVSSATNFGIFFGSGVPTLSAAQGSLYLRSDGSSTSTRLYVNTNGATTWTNVTTAA